MTLRQVAETCCKGINCAAVFENVESESFVVRGRRLAERERSSLALGDNEEAVEIPRELVLALAARFSTPTHE